MIAILEFGCQPHRGNCVSIFLCNTSHPTLKSLEMPMYKGIEANVGYP